MKKYAVIPGMVVSKNDGQRHFIAASKLMMLYGVSPVDCVVLSQEAQQAGIDPKEYILLTPRPNGDYSLPGG